MEKTQNQLLIHKLTVKITSPIITLIITNFIILHNQGIPEYVLRNTWINCELKLIRWWYRHSQLNHFRREIIPSRMAYFGKIRYIVTSLLKRWLSSTHQSAVHQAYPEYYLDKFAFRFNRWSSRSRKIILSFNPAGCHNWSWQTNN